VDGYLLAIHTTWKKHAKIFRLYFSGQYQRYGINIQACCDSHCRFTFLGIGLDTRLLLLPMQLACMNAAAQAEHREIVSNKYPHWSLAREEMVKLVKQQYLTRPAAC
jgi:hypothetical protein